MSSGSDVHTLGWSSVCICPAQEACTCGAKDNLAAALRDEITRYFITYRGVLYRYLRSCGYGSIDAEDATQDAFLALYRARLRGQHIKEPLAWLFTCAKRRMIDRSRHTSVERGVFEGLSRHLEDTLPDEGQDCEENFIAREQRTAFTRALQTLSPLQRASVHFRAEGLSLRETANILGVTSKRVSQAYQRGIRRLRTIIDAF